MNLEMSPKLKLNPNQIPADGQEHTIQVHYSVGADDVTRACDRITVDGTEQPEKECFPVIGTKIDPQPESRTIRVIASNGAPFIFVKAFVHEVNEGNDAIDAELERSAPIIVIPQD
jgi:hypothetical protein